MASWGKYARISLLLHLVLLPLLGLSLQQKIFDGDKSQPVKVKLAPVVQGAGSTKMAGGGGSSSAVSAGGSGTGAAAGTSDALLEELLEAPTESAATGVEETAPVGLVQQSGPAGEKTSSGSSAAGTGNGGQNSGGRSGGGNSSGSGSGNGTGNGSGNGNGSGGGGEDLSRGASLGGFAKIYPRSAWESGEEGSCVVQVDVSASGSVTGVRLLSSTGYDRLDRAAMRSASQASYSPARDRNGSPISGSINIPVRYVLSEGPS